MLKAVALISIFFFFVAGLNVSVAEDLYEKLGITKPERAYPVPPFVLKDLNGNEVYINDYLGKVVFINFWATWCQPCILEMPAIERLYQKFKDKGFIVLAVSIDTGGVNLVKSFVKKNKLTFPVLLDPYQEVMSAFNVSAIPTTYLLDRKGLIKSFASGAREWDNESAVKLIERLIRVKKQL